MAWRVRTAFNTPSDPAAYVWLKNSKILWGWLISLPLNWMEKREGRLGYTAEVFSFHLWPPHLAFHLQVSFFQLEELSVFLFYPGHPYPNPCRFPGLRSKPHPLSCLHDCLSHWLGSNLMGNGCKLNISMQRLQMCKDRYQRRESSVLKRMTVKESHLIW